MQTTDPSFALLRAPADSLATQCELSFIDRAPIAPARLREQHEAYAQVLRDAGCEVRKLPPIESLPDSVFVEDDALVLDECVVLARPGAASRRPEVGRIADELRLLRPRCLALEAPATLDGGDVLRIGRTLHVGVGVRTNAAGVALLSELLKPFGYRVEAVRVPGALHLKTACTALDDETLLLNRDWLEPGAFAGWRAVEVDEGEPFAANVLRLGRTLVANSGFPRTLERVQAHAQRAGLEVLAVDIGEFGKAEAGLTCLSLIA